MKQLLSKLTRIKALFLAFVMPRIKIWSEIDDWNGVKFYWNDKAMRLLMKTLCGVHIEFGDIKINIYIPYGA
jgi:hypothetical protein